MKEFELKLLNNTQKEDTEDLLRYYKLVYICNTCGRVYGSNNKERHKICPICETEMIRGRKK